jgi:hypothetical protein
MQNQDVRHKNPRLYGQSGNALWFILVAIALLSALTLTLTRNSGKMADNMDQEEARMIAERVARELNSIDSAVQRLQTINKCGDEEISFDNYIVNLISAGMGLNNRAPMTGPRAYTCHLYEARGAAMNYNYLPQDLRTPAAITASPNVGWYFTAANSVNGVGPEAPTETICDGSTRNCGDLIVGINGVKDSICLAYNKLVGINTIPVDTDDYTSIFFTGNYAVAASNDARINVGAGDATSALYGVKTACVFSSGSPTPHNLIYKVLIAR